MDISKKKLALKEKLPKMNANTPGEKKSLKSPPNCSPEEIFAVPFLELQWLLKTAISKWGRYLPKKCPSCDSEDIEICISHKNLGSLKKIHHIYIKCRECMQKSQVAPAPSARNIIIVRDWLASLGIEVD